MLATMLATAAVSPAAADGFDALAAAAMQVPDDVLGDRTGLVFDFVSPANALRAGVHSIGLGHPELDQALLDPDAARQRTGIDFPRLDGLLQFGQPPNRVMLLVGDALDPAAIRSALEGRGFTESQSSGVPVFAAGDDNAISIAKRDPADPFGANLGRSQRIAIADGRAVVAANWAALARALPFPDEPGTSAARLLSAMITAAQGATRAGAQAYQANAFNVAAFLELGDPIVLGADGRPQLAEQGPAGFSMPPFVFAMFVAASQADQETAQLVLLYTDRTSAEAGTAEIARRLEAFPANRMVRADFRSNVVDAKADGAPVAIGIVTVMFTAAPAGAAGAELQRWLAAVYQRGFSVLSILR
jgi:hypothetical protein